MPLTTDPQQRFANYDIFSISFPMFDGTKEVTCVVTSEALQDLAAPDGRHLESTEDLFRDYWTCTKTSGPPSSGRMKPNPRSVLKNLTRPLGIINPRSSRVEESPFQFDD